MLIDKLINLLQNGIANGKSIESRIGHTFKTDHAVLIDDKGWSEIDTIINL